jgi:hypothetical protein
MTFLSRNFSLLLLVIGAAGACSGRGDAAAEAPGGPAATPAAAPGGTRQITFNGKPATKQDLEILTRFEHAWGVQVPSGSYWYDNLSGAAGLWGGPTRGFLGAGLGLGGMQVPANASVGDKDTHTGVFINGREIHPLDIQGLTQMLGQAPWPGRWWVDGQGNFGPEGGGALGNVLQLAARRQGSGSYYKSDIGTGSSTFVGSGCAAVSGRLRSSDSDSSYSYYVGC